MCGLIIDTAELKGETLSNYIDTIIEINNATEAEELLKDFPESYFKEVLDYHITNFFKINSIGKLFVLFSNCSSNWDALINIQKAANGKISQIGIWTEQPLFDSSQAQETYDVKLVADLQAVAESLANKYSAPASILLSANTAKVATGDGVSEIVLPSKFPSLTSLNARYVSVLLGQDSALNESQANIASATPIGIVGIALGFLAKASVGQSIGWVEAFDMSQYFYGDIEFGFGDSTIVTSAQGVKTLTNSTPYDSVNITTLNELSDKGYIYLLKYNGYSGVYLSGDNTCTNTDYKTIARNRTIDKSRRLVRQALLPYVNSPIKVDPSTGLLSAAQITVFSNLVSTILNSMASNEEISSIGVVTIPSNQNILKNDTLIIKYSIIPLGVAHTIDVTEDLTITQ